MPSSVIYGHSLVYIYIYIYIYIHMHYTCRHICVKSHMWHLEEEGLRPPDLSPCI